MARLPQSLLLQRSIWFAAIVFALAEPSSSLAQLIPDATLGSQSSTISTNGLIDTVNGGVRSGSNLFHSFLEFNVGSGRSLYFSDPGVNNILTRVTGTNPSTINGRLGVNGNANLFLLNPNGILFGAGASLDIRGSFTATTAAAVKFSDGSEFSAVNPNVPNLLTISVPIGLQRGIQQPSATLVNRGNLSTGQDLTLVSDRLDLQGQLQAGGNLTLQATDTVHIRDTVSEPFLARAGGDLTVRGDRGIDILALNHPTWTAFQSGGNLSLVSDGVISGDARFASQGNFEVRPITQELATFISLYDPIITSAGDVNLALNYTGASLLVEAGGNIRVQGILTITTPDIAAPFVGDDVILNTRPGLILRSGQTTRRYATNSGSVAGSSTGLGIVPAAGITLNRRVNVANGGVVRLTAGGAGDIRTQQIDVAAGEITLNSGGSINTNGRRLDTSTSNGNGGTIRLNAAGDVLTGDLLAFSDDFFTNGGTIAVLAGRTATLGQIATWSLDASGGNVTLSAGGAIAAQDIDTVGFIGNGGAVTVRSGSNITLANMTTYSTEGNGGNVNLTATGDITTTGVIDTSTIDGNSGKVSMTAGGTVTPGIIDTSIYGSGEAGDIEVSARSLFLNNGAQILSVSKYGAAGNSGDITINTTDTVRLSGVGPGDTPSAIFTLADLYSTGNGGNITINTGSLVMRDGSEILANHFGDGVNTRAGNITIRARDMVSLEGFRVRSAEADSPGTGIASNVSFGGVNKQGGTIDIQAGGLELLNGSYISTSLERRASGQGGNILLNIGRQNAPGNVVIAGSATRESGIFSRTEATSIGNGGNIQLNAGSVTLRENGTIGAETNNPGNSGRIGINAASLSVSARSAITAETTTAGNAGAITFLGDRLTLTQGGQIRTGTSSAGQAGAIAIGSINAPVNQVTLSDPDSGIFTNTQRGSSGNGGNITLDARTLFVSNQAQINASTSGRGNAGNVTIRTTDTTLRDGSITIGVAAGGSGSGGVIDVQTRSLVLANRGRIQSQTLGAGRAGDIQVEAEAIAISDPFSGIISGSSDPVRRGENIGDGGNIRLTAETLRIFNEGIVSASTFSNGRSGKIDVTANVVELTSQGKLSATTQGRGEAGSITVTAGDRVTIAGEGSGMFANTTPQSSGKGGSIFVTTGELLLQNQGQITAASRGRGKGGDIQLAANQVELSDRAAIIAETASTQGGNIQMQVRDLLLLRRNSLISASAGTAQAGGNGGNITIDAGFVIGVLSENSDISANAFTGNGGRVNITAQGIFGLQFRPKLTPFSDITASSQFGISGTVTLNTLNIDPNRGLVQLPSDFTDSTNQVAQTCSPQQRGNSFVITGRGGVSPDPSEALNQTGGWQGEGVRSQESGVRRDESRDRGSGIGYGVSPIPYPPYPIPYSITEATEFRQNPDGSIALVADGESTYPATATVDCQTRSAAEVR